MHDQIFWSADVSAFSPFQRATSLIASVLLVGGILLALVATAGGIVT
jgi:hypothetical protein